MSGAGLDPTNASGYLRDSGRDTAVSRASGPGSRRTAVGTAGQVCHARGTAAAAPGQRGQPGRHGAPPGPARPRPGAGARADHRRADHRGPGAGDQGRDRRARLRALPHLDRRYGRGGRRAALAERAVSRGRGPHRGGNRQEGRQEAGDGLQGPPAGPGRQDADGQVRRPDQAGQYVRHEDRGSGRGDPEGITDVGGGHGNRPTVRRVGRPGTGQRSLAAGHVGPLGSPAEGKREQRREQTRRPPVQDRGQGTGRGRGQRREDPAEPKHRLGRDSGGHREPDRQGRGRPGPPPQPRRRGMEGTAGQDEHADPRGRVGHHQRDHPPIKEESSGAGVLGDLPEPVRRDSHQADVDLLPGQHRRH